MKIPITVHNPAFIPNKLITSENISSGDVGITNVDNVTLDSAYDGGQCTPILVY